MRNELNCDNIIKILNNSISVLNKSNTNFRDTARFNNLNSEQSNIFCNLVNISFESIINKIKTNDIILSDQSNNNFTFKLTLSTPYSSDIFTRNQMSPVTTQTVDLTKTQLIKLIIDSLLFFIIKFEGKNIFMTDSNNFCVFADNTNNSKLKLYYLNLIQIIVQYMLSLDGMAEKLNNLSTFIETSYLPNNNLEGSIVINPSAKVIPATPKKGWEKGGTGRKRKYKKQLSSTKKNRRNKKLKKLNK